MNRLYLAILSLLAANSSIAEGICNYGKESLAAVICFGPAILSNTAVRGNIKVVGPLTARGVQAKSLQVTGSAEVHNTQIVSMVEITGYLQSYGSHFYSSMTVEGDQMLLDHTIVGGDITMTSNVNKPIITLQCSSSISGNVTFGGVAGVLQVSDDSAMQGKVNNGVLEFIRPKCD